MNGAQAYCVLGMHRSGTSALTGLLEDAGVYLGPVSRWNPYNPRGNQENPDIVRLNDAVLAENGAGWDDPPSAEPGWSASQRATRSRIIGQYAEHGAWAFKDPRTLFTLRGWLEDLPGMRLLGTFRHPGAVAQSLHRRGDLPAARGFELWMRYNERLLALREELGFELVSFDLSPAAYLEQAAVAFRHLGLEAAPRDLVFFETALRTEELAPPFREPPAPAMDLYQRLGSVRP